MTESSRFFHKRTKSLPAALTAVLLSVIMMCVGCATKPAKDELKEVEYTVVCNPEIPRELLKKINECKEKEFQVTYTSQGYVYIARGYGKQETGGYSVCIREMTADSDRMYFDSELLGPKKGEAVNKLPTYPFVVVKTEDVGKSVSFR